MEKKLIELPKLPTGMGGYSWNDKEKGIIKYRKYVKGKYLSVNGKSISEVNKKMKEKEKEYERLQKLNMAKDKAGTVEQKMNDWLYLFKQGSITDNSFDRYESTFNSHIVGSSFGKMQERGITSEDIQSFIKGAKRVKDGEELSYSSKKKIYELLNQYFRYRYAKEPYLNPMLQVPKPKKNTDEVLKEELIIFDDNEIDIFCKEAGKKFVNGIGGYKHGQLLMFIMWTFIRLGEARALQWKDIDLENGTLNINKNYQRVKCRSGANIGGYENKVVPTKNKQTRKFKMCKKAIDCITEYKKQKKPISEEEYVFTGNDGIISENTINNMYKLIKRNAGLTEKNVTIHGLRHTGISYFLRHGVPVEVVSKLAGHSSIQITLDVYYSVIEEQKLQAVESLDDLMKK